MSYATITTLLTLVFFSSHFIIFYFSCVIFYLFFSASFTFSLYSSSLLPAPLCFLSCIATYIIIQTASSSAFFLSLIPSLPTSHLSFVRSLLSFMPRLFFFFLFLFFFSSLAFFSLSSWYSASTCRYFLFPLICTLPHYT